MADDNPPPAPQAQTVGTLNQAQTIDQSQQGGVRFGDNAANFGTVVGGNYYAAPAPTPPAALHQLRAPAADFVGRAGEIARITAALRGTTAICGVQGLGGSGKTELALKAAQAVLPDFPDAQLVLDLRGAGAAPLTPAAALQTALRALAPADRLPDDLAELQGLYRAALTGKRALILADDAHDAAQVRPLLPPPGCALLVTSRQHFPLPGMTAVALGTLPPAEAVALLTSICDRLDSAAAARLAQLCGDLPLALRVSAGLLAATPDWSVEEYLAELQERRLALLADPDDPAASVAASLALSWAALDAAGQAALAQASVFAASFDRESARAVIVLPAASVDPVLRELGRRSLLDYDAPTTRYSLHALVRAFASEHGIDLEAARLRHAQRYAGAATAAERLYIRGGANVLAGLALFDRERAEIDAGWRWVRAHAGELPAAELLLAYADGTAYVGELRYARRTERIPQLEAALEAARRLGRKEAEAAFLGNLGNAYSALGEVRQAIGFHEQALTLNRAIGDRQGEGNNLGNLGTAYYALGEVRQAIGFFEQWLALARATGDQRGEAGALGNLGSAYYALSEVRQASGFYEQALALARAIGDRQGEGAALGNLGNAYYALDEVPQAIGFYEQDLALARAIGDRHGEGAALGNLGSAYAALGDTRRAIDFHEQHLAIAREIGDRRGEALASWNLGPALEQQGDLAGAVAAMQVCVAYEREIGHPDAESHAAQMEALAQRLAAEQASGQGQS